MSLRGFLSRLGSIAILVAILCQATPTAPFPINRDRGSAFDATTTEVAVLTQRDDVEHQKALFKSPYPLVVFPDFGVLHVPAVLPFKAPPKQTGPPVLPVRLLMPPTRAPPIIA